MYFNSKYRYYIVLLLALYTFINTVICRLYYYFHMDVSMPGACIIIFIITLCTWECSRLSYPFINKKVPLSHNIIQHVAVFFICGLIISSTITIIINYIFGIHILHQPYAALVNPLKMTLTYTVLINLLFHLLNTIFIYQEEYRKKMVESESLKRMHAQAELLAIKQQINPHFLFNNLNVLSGLVLQKSNDANHFIEAFSQVYMHILSNQNKEFIELYKELEFLQPYMFLLTQRFPDALQLQVNIPHSYQNCYIIPVALQMLVENAIKHNVISAKKPLVIKIFTDENNTLIVQNEIRPKLSSEPSTYGGLNNIRKRYQLITGKEIEVLKNETTFSVILPLIEINAYEGINN